MAVKIQTIKDIKRYLLEELTGFYPETEISAFANIIRDRLHLTGQQLLAFPEKPLPGKQASEIVAICKELKTGKPIQYVLGETCFFNCTITLDASTLIPRPETEELVDLILKENRGYNGLIIDIGTGSGAIAIALAVNLPGSMVTATDISAEALKKAGENAALNNVNVQFIESDIFNSETDLFTPAGIIVSNPPYVRESEKKNMHQNVTGFEPHSALFVPDSEPLRYYSAILRFAEKMLEDNGRVYFEINEALWQEMNDLMHSMRYSDVRVREDINGKKRFITGIKNG